MAEPEADRAFGEMSHSFPGGISDLIDSLPAEALWNPPITARMREVRSLPLGERKAIFLADRLGDQRDWYASHAHGNRRKVKVIYRLVLLAQASALAAAVALVRWPDSQVNLTGVFAAVAAALIGWTQMKKHEELASVYGLTAQRLDSLVHRMPKVAAEEDISELVGAAEDIIARENSMWLLRRQR